MFFSRDKDEDDDFTPNPNYHSNLASIFSNSSSDGNSNLTYTAPKQPRKHTKPVNNPVAAAASGGNSSSVLIVRTALTFKMVDEGYQSQGRLGVAVIKVTTQDTSDYQLLVYRNKLHHYCSARITRDFKFHIQPKNYCSFYDKMSTIWSLLFDNPLELSEFALEVGLARWWAGEPTSPIMWQDLWSPANEGQAGAAAVGDNLQVTYTLHTVTHIDQTEESQTVWVTVEDSGWKQALVGVLPTSQKLVILQPFMLGDLNPEEVVYNSAMALRLTVLQVVKAERPAATQPDIQTKAKEVAQSRVRARSDEAEGSQSPRTEPKVSKADLITRMAKMGQALPFNTAAPPTSDSDDLEEDLEGKSRTVPKPRARIQHAPTQPPAPVPAPVVGGLPAITPPVPVSQQIQPQWITPPYMAGSMYPAPQLQSPLDSQSHLHVFLSEVRTTNSELRMGITRLTDKVEGLHNKLDDSDRRTPAESTALLQRLLDNEQDMKNQLQSVLSSLDSIRLASDRQAAAAPSPPPPTHCQSCQAVQMEKTSLSEQLRKLTEENEYLQASVSAQKDALQNAKIADQDQLARIETLQKELDEARSRESAVNERLQAVETEKNDLAATLDRANREIGELQTRVGEKQMCINRLEQALRDSEDFKMDEVRRNLQELGPRPNMVEHIKRILNTVYKMVKLQFEPDTAYDVATIQSVLADTFKGVTLQYLDSGGDLPSELMISSMEMEKAASSVEMPSLPTSDTSLQNLVVDDKVIEHNSPALAEEEMHPVSSMESFTPAQISDPPTVCVEPPSTSTADTGDVVEGAVSKDDTKSKADNQRSKSETGAAAANSAQHLSDNIWKPQPPPPPLFDEEENDDDWLN